MTQPARPGRRTTITLDDRGPARPFEGIGALSQGGQQRLLIDYPEPQRSELLDLLFAPGPGAGAAFQTLKVEVGGDACGSEGAEPSHAHARDELGAVDPSGRGYLWWLMREAKARNADIVFEALPWGAPGWIGDADPDAPVHDRYFGDDTIEYLIAFLRHAEAQGTPISYLGLWNEYPYRADDGSWDHRRLITRLKERIRSEGLDAKLVGFDHHWDPVVPDMMEDEVLREAIDVVGVHYERQIPAGYLEFLTGAGKPIWQSEESVSLQMVYSRPARTTRLIGEWYGATLTARILNTNYIDLRVTKANVLFFVCGFYDVLYAPGAGLASAESPWSGHYDVQPGIWAIAHTTQFAQPGWRYLDEACGRFDASLATEAEGGGTYVALAAPDGGDWTVVAETRGLHEPVEVTLQVPAEAGLARAPVHLWRSTIAEQLVHAGTVEPSVGGDVTVRLEPDAIYTLTTTSGQRRLELAPSPPDAAFPLPYRDDFRSPDASERSLPRYLASMSGSFELTGGAGRDGGQGLEQVVVVPPIEWIPVGAPFAILGDESWTDYRVRTRIRLPAGDADASAGVLGRVRAGVEHATTWPWDFAEGGELDFSRRGAYELEAFGDGRWELRRRATGFSDGSRAIVLAAGAVAPLGDAWHELALELRGLEIAAFVDDLERPVARVVDDHDEAHLQGLAGLVSGWNRAAYDELVVEPLDGATRRLDDTELTYSGSWERVSGGARDHGGGHTASDRCGDEASFEFTGARLILFGTTAPDGGYASVSLDGGVWERVDFFREARAVGTRVVYVSRPLGPGRHTLRVRVTGEANPGALGTFVRLDRVDVVAAAER